MINAKHIKNYFKGKLPKQKFNLYSQLADYLELKGDDALCFSAGEAYENFNFDNPYLEYRPSVNDWKEFLNDDFVSKLLNDEMLKSKRLTFRKLLSEIDETKELSNQQIKALETLKTMIEYSEEHDNSVIYVQYTAPIRFDASDDDNESIINEYCEDTTGKDDVVIKDDIIRNQQKPNKVEIELNIDDYDVKDLF